MDIDKKNFNKEIDYLVDCLEESSRNGNEGLLETAEMKKQRARQLIEEEFNSFETDFLEGYEIILKQLAPNYLEHDGESVKIPIFSIKI